MIRCTELIPGFSDGCVYAPCCPICGSEDAVSKVDVSRDDYDGSLVLCHRTSLFRRLASHSLSLVPVPAPPYLIVCLTLSAFLNSHRYHSFRICCSTVSMLRRAPAYHLPARTPSVSVADPYLNLDLTTRQLRDGFEHPPTITHQLWK
jgi:hypothetical protein